MHVLLRLLWILACLHDGLAQDVQLGELDLNVNRKDITISGFSSGGNFAQQLYISYSSMFSGLGVFSHTFYRCGRPNGNIDDWDLACTKLGNLTETELYQPVNSLQDIQFYYNENLIDDPNNMENSSLYIYAGTRNFLFSTDMSMKILHVFEPYIKNPEKIRTRVQEATLLLPTDNFGLTCAESAERNYFLGNCGFSGAYEALRFLIGDQIRRPAPTTAAKRRSMLRRLLSFDQTEFFVDARHDMDILGFIYIPKKCRFIHTKCLLHTYMHGCLTGREFNGTNHILYSGFLEVAEENNIIMLFPQALSSRENEIGCWDTFGLTGELHATKVGAQVTVVRRILASVMGDDPKRFPPLEALNNTRRPPPPLSTTAAVTSSSTSTTKSTTPSSIANAALQDDIEED